MALSFLRRNHHCHLAVFYFREGLDLRYFRRILFYTLKRLGTQLPIGHFTIAGTQHYSNLITIGKEVADVVHLNLVVAFICTRTEFDFLNLHLLLAFPGFVALLGLSVSVFTVIHQLACRRFGGRGSLYQIDILLSDYSQNFTN